MMQNQVHELTWWETLGILGGDLFVAIVLGVVIYIFIEIVTGSRQDRRATEDLQEYADELEHDRLYNLKEDEDARSDFH